MEHQDTKLTSMRPRLKELNDNPYIEDETGEFKLDWGDGNVDVFSFKCNEKSEYGLEVCRNGVPNEKFFVFDIVR